jgi:hypothetical protein
MTAGESDYRAWYPTGNQGFAGGRAAAPRRRLVQTILSDGDDYVVEDLDGDRRLCCEACMV